MLDLGVWVSIQSWVERIHKGKVMRTDELSNSVMTVFHDFPWKLTFQLIQSGKGNIEVVEEYRGSKKPLILGDLPTVPEAECQKGYTYDYDSGSNGSYSDGMCSGLLGGEEGDANAADLGITVELAFDNF